MQHSPETTTPTEHEVDVAIVGGGPVGTLLAVLLGRRGHRVALIERWEVAYSRPRAVTFDHEIARILATLGIDADHDPAITHYDELYYWKSPDGEDLQVVDWQSTSASGWRVRYWFNQPDLEERLTDLALSLPSVTYIRGWEACSIEQNESGVELTLCRNTQVSPDDPARMTVRAGFAVGADGANSFVRESLGIENVDRGYFFDWLILDLIPQETWTGSPSQWQLCDPSRPTTIVPGGPGRRRWEFMVLPGEDPQELQSEERSWELLEPWGMTPDNAELERSAVYRFQARWATTWHRGRVMIAGDAAHLMPPFAGEGMCAGVRDAVALSWRLDAILDGVLDEAVLDSYTTERVEHAKHYIRFSQELGEIICITDPEAAAERDARLRQELADRGGAPVPTDVCQLGPGAWSPDAAHAGELSVQGVVRYGDPTGRFDQVVGQGWILLGLDHDPTSALTGGQLEQLARLGGRAVHIGGDDADVVDVEGTYREWFHTIDSGYALIRPDFYVAATANDAATLRDRVEDVFSTLHITQPEVAR